MKNIKNRAVITALCFVLQPLLAYILMETAYGWSLNNLSPTIILANYLCIGFGYFFLCALTNKIGLSGILTMVFFMIWGIANGLLVIFRGSPIQPWDLTSITTAVNVAGNYKMHLNAKSLVTILLFVIMVIATIKFCHKRPLALKKENLIFRLSCFLLGGLCLWGAMNKTVLEGLGVATDVWDQAGAYTRNGPAAGFALNLKFLEVEEPEGYSVETVKDIFTTVEEKSLEEGIVYTGEKPNIIAIMNESWADFESFGHLSLNQGVLDYIHSLPGIQGVAYTSVNGAGTSASEYEFLTGNSMAFLPSGSIPYQQYVTVPTPSLARVLKSQGYTCMAFHPGDVGSWQRNQAYPLLGFDSFKSLTEMNVPVVQEHGYASDASDFEQIIYEFEHKAPEEKLFLFNVTIQSHGSYTDETFKSNIYLTNAKGQYPMAEQYLGLVKKTDEAFKLLVDYFSAQTEPTVILMFGDHQPAVETGFLDEAFGLTQAEMDMDGYMGKYQVPFVIWANYELPEITIEKTSLNYLSSYLLDCAGLGHTAYGRYLKQLKENLPVITFPGYYDAAGRAYSHMEENQLTELISRYSIVQYGQIFGQKAELEAYYTDIAEQNVSTQLK